jgi:hypothetical protein
VDKVTLIVHGPQNVASSILAEASAPDWLSSWEPGENALLGTYTITARAWSATGTELGTHTITVDLVSNVGIQEDLLRSALQIYPVPANNTLHVNVVNFDVKPSMYSLISMSGAVVEQGILGSATQIDVSTLPKGLYVLQVQGADASTQFKVTVE